MASFIAIIFIAYLRRIYNWPTLGHICGPLRSVSHNIRLLFRFTIKLSINKSFRGSSPSSITLRIGSEKYASGGTIVNVKRIVVHEDYNPRTIDFDYSLLELSEPLTFSDKVQPIELPTVDDVLPDGSICVISGWGNTLNSSESRAHLRGASVPIVNQEKCIDAYQNTNHVTPRMICAGYEEGGKDCKH